MTSPARAASALFSTANPHALATILEASQTKSCLLYTSDAADE